MKQQLVPNDVGM